MTKKSEITIEKLKESDERTDFRVYNCPTQLKNELISMAKLYYDNEMWKVLADGLELLKKEKEGDHNSKFDDYEKRLNKLEEQVNMMKKMQTYSTSNEKKSESRIRGFGEPPENDTQNDIEYLKDISGESNDES